MSIHNLYFLDIIILFVLSVALDRLIYIHHKFLIKISIFPFVFYLFHLQISVVLFALITLLSYLVQNYINSNLKIEHVPLIVSVVLHPMNHYYLNSSLIMKMLIYWYFLRILNLVLMMFYLYLLNVIHLLVFDSLKPLESLFVTNVLPKRSLHHQLFHPTFFFLHPHNHYYHCYQNQVIHVLVVFDTYYMQYAVQIVSLILRSPYDIDIGYTCLHHQQQNWMYIIEQIVYTYILKMILEILMMMHLVDNIEILIPSFVVDQYQYVVYDPNYFQIYL